MSTHDQVSAGRCGTRKPTEFDDELSTEETQRILDAGVTLSIIRVRQSVEDFLNETKNAGLTRSIVREALHAVLSGPAKTKGGNLNANDTTTISAKPETPRPPLDEHSEGAVTRLPISRDSSEVSSEATLSSLNLLQDTATHLHTLMKNVTGPLAGDEANPFKLPDIDRVNAAANCAKQLYSVMRLRLDAIKILKEKH